MRTTLLKFWEVIGIRGLSDLPLSADHRRLVLPMAVGVGRVGRITMRCSWIPEHGDETLSLEVLGRVELAQFAESRVELGQRLAVPLR